MRQNLDMAIETNNSDDASRVSAKSGQTWSPAMGTLEEGFVMIDDADLHPEDNTSESIASAPPTCTDRNEDDGIEGLDSHEYPPFSSAVPAKEDAFPAPIPQMVEVDAESRTIRVEMESNGSNNNTEAVHVTTSSNKKSPVHKLSRYHKCWLIVFVRKCARKTRLYSRAAARKYSPEMKRLANHSATAIKNASNRSASNVRTQSNHYRNRAVKLDEKHQFSKSARRSVKRFGRGIGKASKATVKGAKQVSVTTAKSIQDLEEKHHLMRKSKNSLKKGGRMIRNAWNGKPLNTKKPPSTTTASVASAPVFGRPVIEPNKQQQSDTVSKAPPPTNE